MEGLFSTHTLWIVGGAGLLLLVIIFWFTQGQLQALRAKAEEERTRLLALTNRTLWVARRLVNLLSPRRRELSEEEARVLHALEESLQNLSRIKEDSALRFEEEAFLQAVVAVGMEVARAHQSGFSPKEQEMYAELAREWAFLDGALDAAERAYNQAARAHNAWCTLFPFSIVAFWQGFRPLPLFEMEGDVEGAFLAAFRKAPRPEGGDKT